MKYIDLHVHSNASDGTFTPTELVVHAAHKHLSAFALTDHDSISGITEAINAANSYEIQIIPGVELSTAYKSNDVHILGLFIDYTDKAFLQKLQYFNDLRATRNEQMCTLLVQEGFDISPALLADKFGNTVLTRAHIARYLFDKGYISSMKEAFDKYISSGGSCYVPKVKCSPLEAIKIILDAKGFPILAHPLLYNFTDSELNELILLLKESGLKGIEAIYSLNENQDEANMLALGHKYNLIITGGSDFHGLNKPHIDLGVGMGNLRIPSSLLKQFTLS
ncbi:MAG: PHP domain-containing protein [Lachnotalea sp.]